MPQAQRKAAELQKTWQQTKSENTRNAILDAAIACFYEFGYNNTTTDKIAKEAGVSRGAMLHHFPSKIDIVRAAVDHLHAKRLKAFRNSIAAIPGGADRVKLGVQAYWKHVNHPMFVAFFELSVAARTDPELEAILGPAQAAFDEAYATIVAECQKAGVAPGCHASAALVPKRFEQGFRMVTAIADQLALRDGANAALATARGKAAGDESGLY